MIDKQIRCVVIIVFCITDQKLLETILTWVAIPGQFVTLPLYRRMGQTRNTHTVLSARVCEDCHLKQWIDKCARFNKDVAKKVKGICVIVVMFLITRWKKKTQKIKEMPIMVKLHVSIFISSLFGFFCNVLLQLSCIFPSLLFIYSKLFCYC